MKALDYILRLVLNLQPALKVTVREFYLSAPQESPETSPAETNAGPQRYHTDLLLINRRDSLIFLKEVFLIIDRKVYHSTLDASKISLEPQQALRISMAFAVPDDHLALSRGKFKLKLIAASGRKTTVKGHFPLKEI